MIKSRVIRVVLIITTVLFISSCFGLPKGLTFSGGSKKSSSSEPDQSYNSGGGGDSGQSSGKSSGGKRQGSGSLSGMASAAMASSMGLTAMTQKMMFTMIYSQVFFIGGFGATYYELEETQGAIWRVTSVDADGQKSQVEAERALLKKLPNGDQWWYLAWRVNNDEQFEFEALMNKNNMAKKIRYFNADLKRVEEAIFDENAKGDSESAPPPEAAANALALSQLFNYTTGRETIRVNAGSFNTERIEWSFVEQQENATYKYRWWVDTKAAGGLVKFEWTKSTSKESLTGELYSLKKGYKTKFNSF